QQRRDVGVVIGVAADQEGAAPAGAERVGPEAAEEQVAAAAPGERVVARPADQDVVGGAAVSAEVVVAVAAEDQGRYGQTALQITSGPGGLGVDEEVGEGGPPGGGEGSQGIAADPEGDGVAGPRAERQVVGVGGALDHQGAPGGVAGVGLDRHGHGEG